MSEEKEIKSEKIEPESDTPYTDSIREAVEEEVESDHFNDEELPEPPKPSIVIRGPEKLEETNGVAQDRTPVVVLGIIVFGIVAIIIWAGFNIGPPVQAWIESKLNPDPTAVVVGGIECPELQDDGSLSWSEDEINNFCQQFYLPPEIEALESPSLVCPGCAPCPVAEPEMIISDNREEIENYLFQADEALSQMEASIALMEEVRAIMVNYGAHEGLWQQALDDHQWKLLLNHMDRKVDDVRITLNAIWPPGPHNSCNPIMDAHARMLLAFSQLDRARDNMMKGFYNDDAGDVVSYYQSHVNEATGNMRHARAQLSHVR